MYAAHSMLTGVRINRMTTDYRGGGVVLSWQGRRGVRALVAQGSNLYAAVGEGAV